MANLVTNIGKGRLVYYAAQAQAGTGGAQLAAVVLEASGLEADGTLQDYDTLALLLAGASNEQTTMGRKDLSGVTVTVNDTSSEASYTADELVWASATGNPPGKIVIVYDPTGSSADTALIPLTLHDFVMTPDGTTVTVSIDPDGLAVSEDA